MKKNKVLVLMVIAVALAFQMCEKEEDVPAYVGNWETEAYKFPVGGELIDQKMNFDFAETSFESQIQNIIQGATINFLGIRGDVMSKGLDTLGVELTEIGLFNAASNDFDWKTKTENTDEFNGLYHGYLSNSLPAEFNAIWNVENDVLSLIIPQVDTITLYKR